MPLDGEDEAVAPIIDPREAAEEAGLRYVSDETPGITRRRAGKGFSYRLPKGGALKDTATLGRIRSLAVPPAWTQVWICPSANGHIQATGRDQKGRKQYRYHARWREVRDAAKYDRMVDFARALPALRARVDADMRRPGLAREKVLATVVHLLETTLIRVGNDDYAKQNQSYGLTTLESRHVAVTGSELRFAFTGKSGKSWNLRISDRRVARIVRACQDLPGQELFQYRDADGALHDVSSSDVNDYLREISGREVTAKDFRTWAGTVLAALALKEYERVDSQAAAKRNVRQAIERVAARLGNTPTICRKCYVHPTILDSYLGGTLALEVEAEAKAELREGIDSLRPEEAAVLALLLGPLREMAEA
ncbi:DNA topoisomerase IB [Falsiroseomonas tokyonensis]|uniref:DNA topoisomerase IB n=1 Tax=Falsiroseomonas tokyonensis TaxID=430521 RepID=A0ABV7BZ84_9PROT|nr:DNA topoisomerase IB [Falsiroseomonas tokyonensis]MBU8539507.1 DNA topoisomerase IB [Falsiroseomonas tokyonensis]